MRISALSLEVVMQVCPNCREPRPWPETFTGSYGRILRNCWFCRSVWAAGARQRNYEWRAARISSVFYRVPCDCEFCRAGLNPLWAREITVRRAPALVRLAPPEGE
jgi:hypothetical protein